MKQKWINRTGSDKIVVFFNGWGLDENPFLKMDTEGYDLLMYYQYDNLDCPGLFRDYYNYQKAAYIGYSFGAASMVRHLNNIIGLNPGDCRFDYFAVNGTLAPINDIFGIRKDIFEKTLADMKKTGIEAFYKNLFDDKDDFNEFMDLKPMRDFEGQVKELESLSEEFSENIINSNACLIQKALISEKDRIFNSRSQHAYWESVNVPVVGIKGGHFPYFRWNSWGSSCGNLNMNNKKLIAARFEKNAGDYEKNAMVQKVMASTLIRCLIKSSGKNFGDVLELGCGAGLLTKILLRNLNIDFLTANDISPVYESMLPVNKKIRYINHDMEDASFLPDALDLVISNAAIQWLDDFGSFIERLALKIKSGGTFAFTTFGEDNFIEFSSLGIDVLKYHSMEKIVSMAEKSFKTLHFENRHMKLHFKSPLEVLMHVRSIGANAVSGKYGQKNSLRNLPGVVPQHFMVPAPYRWQQVHRRVRTGSGKCHLLYQRNTGRNLQRRCLTSRHRYHRECQS